MLDVMEVLMLVLEEYSRRRFLGGEGSDIPSGDDFLRLDDALGIDQGGDFGVVVEGRGGGGSVLVIDEVQVVEVASFDGILTGEMYRRRCRFIWKSRVCFGEDGSWIEALVVKGRRWRWSSLLLLLSMWMTRGREVRSVKFLLRLLPLTLKPSRTVLLVCFPVRYSTRDHLLKMFGFPNQRNGRQSPSLQFFSC